MANHNSILEVTTKNLQYNYKKLSRLANKSICAATIKSDAYGIGVLNVFDALYKVNCRHFFVATTQEAIELRKERSAGNIYVLNGLESNNISVFSKYKIIPILNDIDEYNYVSKNIKKYKNLKFGLHVDTGINRLGINFKEFLGLKFKNNIHILISHLASSDESKNYYNTIQNTKFRKAIDLQLNAKIKSLSNSFALILGKNFHFDLVRPGISLYGGHQNTKMKKIIKPVITLKAKILQIKEIGKNEYIGYNQTYKTAKKIKVAVIGIGYGDGVSRLLSSKGKVFYKKNSYKILGRVSMDTITIDITKNNHHLRVGKYIEILNHTFGIDSLAQQCNTIPHEILTSITKRVKRVYI